MSLLMSAAVLLGTFPAAVSAEEAAEQSGANFGVKRGDIVTYAGKYTPIEWRVLDPDMTNTDDDKGMFLLSDNASINAIASDLKGKANEFYDANFSDFCKNAVLHVSQTDKSYTSGMNTLNGELDNAAVFALSAHEFDSLTAEEKSFSGGDWRLRSIAEPNTLYYYSRATYIDTNDDKLHISRTLNSSQKSSVLR